MHKNVIVLYHYTFPVSSNSKCHNSDNYETFVKSTFVPFGLINIKNKSLNMTLRQSRFKMSLLLVVQVFSKCVLCYLSASLTMVLICCLYKYNVAVLATLQTSLCTEYNICVGGSLNKHHVKTRLE